MTALPRGWAGTTVGEITEFKYGKSLPDKSRRPGSINVFGSNGPVGKHDESLTAAPSIIVGRKGSIGEVHYLETPCYPIDTTYYVDHFGGAEPRFIMHLLKNLPLRTLNRATAIPGLNRDDAYALNVGLPPLPEQGRIVAKIDSLSAKSNRARDQLVHIPRLVEKYKQAILAAALRGELTREWRASVGRRNEWDETILERVLTDIRYGTAKKCNYNGGAVGVLRIPNVQHGHIILDDIKSANFTEDEREALRLEEGDILIIRSNGSLDLVGRSAIVVGPAVGMLYAGYLIRLRLDRRLANPSFVQLFLQTAETRARLERLAKSTSGVNNVNSTQLKALPFTRPDLDEQEQIVGHVRAAFTWINRLAAEAARARNLIDHLDQAVLAKAFRGDLVPQDPTDEPASKLLERIRAERSASHNRTGGSGQRPAVSANRGTGK
jgi:type I restriction enzyme, S subunit